MPHIFVKKRLAPFSELRDEYLVLKALLNSLSVNLTDIDKIKE